MTAIHDALGTLSEKVVAMVQAMAEREQSHIEAIEAQIAHVENVLGKLGNEAPKVDAPTQPDNPGPVSGHGLLDG